MDSLKDLLKSSKPEEPKQVRLLKEYVSKFHGEKAQVRVTSSGYNLTISSAPLASILHMETPKIVEYCELDKKLFIRIGHLD